MIIGTISQTKITFLPPFAKGEVIFKTVVISPTPKSQRSNGAIMQH